MRFASAYMLHFLWGVIPFGIFLFWAIHHRENMMSRFVEARLIGKMAPRWMKSRLKLKAGFLMLTLVFSVFALARPQWGFQWQEVTRQGLDILVVVDTSKSMLTQDVKPNRLERTKLAIKDLLKKLEGDRIGLIAFAGEAFLVCPLTADYNGFLLSLNDLSVKTIPRGGTNIGRAIQEALRGYEETESKYKSVIIVTDGDNLEGEPVSWAKKAKEKGIKIYCIGIGTKDGELIQIENLSGEKEFLKDEKGNFVKSRLNERLLQEIALATEGIYVKASGAQFGLDYIYDQELSKLEKREIETKMEKKFYERFQIPLALAFLFLLMESILTAQKRNEE